MTTPTTIHVSQPSPTPLLLSGMARFLLTQTGSVSRPTDSDNLAPEMVTLRATHITVLLGKLLEDRGHLHGGIND